MSFNISEETKENILIVLTVVLVSFICFANSLLGEFISDDTTLIVDKYNVKSLAYIPTLFAENYFGKNDPAGGYRPLTNLTFAIDFAINQLNPYGYHLVNILIHTINCLLIYWLCNNYSKIKLLSLLAALFFAVHPIHSEPVATIYGRPELLTTMFLLGAWIFYIKSSQKSYLYIFSLISYFLALLSKETGIILLGLLLLAQICTEKSWFSKLKPSPKLIGYILATIPYLIMRVAVTKTLGMPKTGQFFTDETFLTRLCVMILGYVKYFELLIWPKDLATVYSYQIIPKVTTFTLPVILALLLILSVLAIGIWQLNKNPLLAFSILFFFVASSAVSNIIFPTGSIVTERGVYLASFSICLLFAIIFYKLYQFGWQKLVVLLSIGILALASFRTYYRNLDFQNDIVFIHSILKYSPGLTSQVYQLAAVYEKKGDLAKAEECYKKIVEQTPCSYYACGTLANIYIKQNRYEEALPLAQKELSVNPNSVPGHLAMARLYDIKENYQKALESILEVTKNVYQPNPQLEYEVGLAFYKVGDLKQAEIRMKKAIELDSSFYEPLVNLAKILQKQNRYEEAIIILDKAIKMAPNDADIYNLYGANLFEQNKLCEAKSYLLKSISLNNKIAETHYNLARVFSKLNLFAEAKSQLIIALNLNPKFEEAKETLTSLNKEINSSLTPIDCPN
ncbi:MAG: tetratricopeptide repeat protein [Acidobacteria bacterium]|nr:tetratricopeptide repeat protein [Acidobacteriota bacterium]